MSEEPPTADIYETTVNGRPVPQTAEIQAWFSRAGYVVSEVREIPDERLIWHALTLGIGAHFTESGFFILKELAVWTRATALTAKCRGVSTDR
jgi:hypothetical protein